MTPHTCCDGECNHDDCCGKVPENCPEHTTPTDDLADAQEHLDARKKEIDENLQRTIHPPFMTTPQDTPEPVKQMVETLHQGKYCGVAPDHWNNAHFEGYKIAQKEIGDWLTTAATTLYNDAYNAGKERAERSKYVQNLVNDAVREGERKGIERVIKSLDNSLLVEERQPKDLEIAAAANEMWDKVYRPSIIEHLRLLTPPTDNPTNV